MTILYRPVLIESAEQAEALPLWTMATIEHHPQDALPQIAMRIVRGWRNRDLIDGRIPHADVVGWTALVPIEAEEQTRNDSGLRGCETEQDFVDYLDGKREHTRTRYVTPWEATS